ncbi:MAG: response regulator [Pseudomonadota bacterium]
MSEQKTCLIIDDSSVIREIAARILSDLGLQSAQAETAVTGLDVCLEAAPDAVLLDWDLPSMGALDFLRGAAELPEEKKPVIILCATENDHQQFTLAKAAGAAYHVLKPYDRQSLCAVLAEAEIIEASAVGDGKHAAG